MAKPIVVTLDGIESSFDHSKLYDARRSIPCEMDGDACVNSSRTVDGLYFLQSGMTAQGYFDEAGRWLQKSELIGLGEDGQPLRLKPSTLVVAQPLEPDPPQRNTSACH